MEKKTLGSFIAVLRKSRGMTQKELGKKLGVTDKTISHWERNESMPDTSIIPLIAETFDISCDELLKGEKAESKENLVFVSEKEDFERFLLREKFKQGLKAGGAQLIFLVCAFVPLSFLHRLEWFITFFIALSGYAISCFIMNKLRKQIKNSPYKDKMTEKQKFVSELLHKLAFPLVFTMDTFLLLTSLYISLDLKYLGGFSDFKTFNFLTRIGIFAAFICFLIAFAVHYYNSLKPSKKSEIISKNISGFLILAICLIFSVLVLHTYTPLLLKTVVTHNLEAVEFENMEELARYMETEKEPFPFSECKMDTLNVMTEFETKDGITFCKFYSYETEELLVSFKWLNFQVEQISFYFENDTYRAEVSFPEIDSENFRESVNKFAPICYTLAVLVPAVVYLFKFRKESQNTEN